VLLPPVFDGGEQQLLFNKVAAAPGLEQMGEQLRFYKK